MKEILETGRVLDVGLEVSHERITGRGWGPGSPAIR